MAYEAITAHTAANRTVNRPDLRRVESITIHWWGDPASYNYPGAFDDVLAFLVSPNPRQSSAHYVVEAGRVACIVDPDEIAWHAGDGIAPGTGNATSIGIECHPRAGAGDYETIAELIAELRAVYGDVPLVPHRKWTNTACPGNYDLGRLDALARATPAAKPVPSPDQTAPTAPAPPVAGEALRRWIVDPGNTLSGIAAHYGLSVATLQATNQIPDPDRIDVGQVLIIPNGGSRVHTVRDGDTLSGIARAWGSSVDLIAGANRIENPDVITAGTVLQIP